MTTQNDVNVASSDLTLVNKYERDYNAVVAEAQALRDDELLNAPTDVETISAAVFAKEAVIAAELDADAATLPKFSKHDYAQLGTRTRALQYAESKRLTAEAPPASIDEKLTKLVRFKNVLLAQVEVLVLMGLLGGVPVETLKFNTGNRQMAANTRHVVVYVKDRFDQIDGRCALTREELAEGERLAEEVHEELARRDEQPKRIAEAVRIRKQMFTLVLRSLAEVERAASYFHGKEADRFMPQVFAHLGKRRARVIDEVTPAVPATPTAPEAPATATAATPAPAYASAAPAGTPIPPGMPGSNPFLK